MTYLTYTPGPWELKKYSDTNAAHWSVWGPNGKFICGFTEMTLESMPTTLADATLLTEAPNLLAALEGLVEPSAGQNLADRLFLARAAIAKAKVIA